MGRQQHTRMLCSADAPQQQFQPHLALIAPATTLQPVRAQPAHAPVALVDGVSGGQHAIDQLGVGAAHLLNQVGQQRLRGGGAAGGGSAVCTCAWPG